MGEIRINLTNFVTIGLIAFLFIFAVQKGTQWYQSRSA